MISRFDSRAVDADELQASRQVVKGVIRRNKIVFDELPSGHHDRRRDQHRGPTRSGVSVAVDNRRQNAITSKLCDLRKNKTAILVPLPGRKNTPGPLEFPSVVFNELLGGVSQSFDTGEA